ncbi:hypothetical protein Lgra_0855 [Legionella gratiana]|uniref:Uncharacterized protein n=1 Tax=Legionella gratiana TaxID=45066 RepID=A0A378JEW7_9GAMM|nr:hypothetical protein [Legionella gratiana]KTD13720.1 hypothetical protein Lgra_0855 [Legionella gratiana]STX45969.1 Uncharacterised protein [Legionella gratiana]
MSSQLQLFSNLEPMLLQYKNTNAQTRKTLLLDVITTVQKLSGEITSTNEAKEHYKVLSYAATLINYADALNRMEHQQFFDILIDFYKMDLDDELQDWFEFGSPGQMRLKKPISAYTPEIWKKFRTAQKAHLKKINKEDDFDLDQLDINHPPVNQLYPIQIQMLGKLFNESVDRISINAKGQIRFAKRFGFYLLPGGGMVEMSHSTKANNLEHKMLEEHLEEEHANLYIKAAPLYNELDKAVFDKRLLETLDSKQAQSLPNEFRINLKEIAGDEDTNAARLHHLVDAIDAQKEKEQNDSVKKSLVELRALIQVQTFELTPLFTEAFEYIKTNAKRVDIQQYLDTRAAGGFQMSHTFIITQPLEKWFKEKFKGVDGEFGDDISGSETEKLTLLECIAKFRTIKFSHLLIGLAAYNEFLDNNSLQIDSVWDNGQFDAARKAIVSEAAKLLH